MVLEDEPKGRYLNRTLTKGIVMGLGEVHVVSALHFAADSAVHSTAAN
jgi:hypothetical protein